MKKSQTGDASSTEALGSQEQDAIYSKLPSLLRVKIQSLPLVETEIEGQCHRMLLLYPELRYPILLSVHKSNFVRIIHALLADLSSNPNHTFISNRTILQNLSKTQTLEKFHGNVASHYGFYSFRVLDKYFDVSAWKEPSPQAGNVNTFPYPKQVREQEA